MPDLEINNVQVDMHRADWQNNQKTAGVVDCVYFVATEKWCYGINSVVNYLAENNITNVTKANQLLPFVCDKVSPELPDISELIQEQVLQDVMLDDGGELCMPNFDLVQKLAEKIWQHEAPYYYTPNYQKPYDCVLIMDRVEARLAEWAKQSNNQSIQMWPNDL